MSYQFSNISAQDFGLKKLIVLAISVLFLVATVGFAYPGSASAATCSGTSCNGKNPSTTGCTANGYLAKQVPVRRTSDGSVISGVYMQLYYSTTCKTNWVRVNANPYCGKATKVIDVAQAGGYHVSTSDTTCASSYSMQVYAPGSTPVQISVTLRDTAGTVRGFTDSYLVQ